ncbi:30S ribosomal protein S17 [Candidatus Saccharibacteria bacterium]|nr:30S ribosomal protein S17 [Candidatus Saccharibacteria bacterium]
MAHTLIGTVTSDKRDKTITVSIVSRETHPLYRKQYSKTRKYTAHDAKNEAHVGDRVQIAMSRPISKTKAYTLVKVIEKSRGTVELKEDVNKAYEAEKIGADAEARARRAAEKAEAEKAAEAEKEAEKQAKKAEGEGK